ncbi:MAG TPA: ABC transporter permease [Negativicutes bacterium]|nr:ABC transporter permease [Negativicutes bacterium]
MFEKNEKVDIPVDSYFSDVCQRFSQHKPAMIGLLVLITEIFLVVFLPILMNLDQSTTDYDVLFGSSPSGKHILGTDDIGRDIFARFIYGGRVSLSVGILSAIISMLVGVPLGLIAGYYRGFWETVIMRSADTFMSFPAMILIMVLVSVLGPSVITIILVIGLLGWPRFARLIYGNVLSASSMDYVEAARAIGTKNGSILLKYILPNTFAPVLIAFTFRAAQAIITESALSFLGMGVQAPQASWGNILYDAQSISVLSQRPWLWVPPGIALVITVLSINFIGDGVRDALDTKMVI